MATVTIKNIPDELYEQLKIIAKANRRSINQEVIFIIEQAMLSNQADFETTLDEIRTLRKSLNLYVTDEEINQAKNEGRP